MWRTGWRDQIWTNLDREWDLIVIGGGITGAGILREAARAGVKTLLVEANDFASGTSSRSSKLVHGGFRYLKNGQLKLTLESVTERERLLQEGKGLINRLGFLFTSLEGDPVPLWTIGAGLIVYDLMAGKWSHQRYSKSQLRQLCPPLTTPLLKGGYRYFDAQTDDARLVLRLIQEAVQDGGTAINYARASSLLQFPPKQVCGIALEDQSPEGMGRSKEIKAKVVINATGAWADEIRAKVERPPRLRLLRGSHLVFSQSIIPLTRAVSLWHPQDKRPVFIFPWEGVVIAGTTDVDHKSRLSTDPSITMAETAYLHEAVHHAFPELGISLEDVISTFSGIRPVVDTGKSDPSKESREHILWREDGLLTVSGGKLTTFRVMARDALRAVRARLGIRRYFDRGQRILDPVQWDESKAASPLNQATQLHVSGRYGRQASDLIAQAETKELSQIPGTPYLWAELRWAARSEGVIHLDDLLLRRLRIGMIVPDGGRYLLPEIRAIAQAELGWDDERWEKEELAYKQLWEESYSIPSSEN
ncbi:MAG: glycerol-3-phosphate dehydrogenase/oxidase [Anaerolineales bacterium]|jgi:glycerol-3-phosphate dehydrogenase